ncbi:unnamed protein product [Hermetia illucens]|uniref:Eukaryotic translation initiation factor 4 gamma 2 n=1 Tax=Hermetia illucens TaxID=343691 RepID=A0A7R8YQH0_HERIL|nr:unnamed protein product [Hermetia illucens]
MHEPYKLEEQFSQIIIRENFVKKLFTYVPYNTHTREKTRTRETNNKVTQRVRYLKIHGKNFAKIRQYDTDVSPRPRRPFPNDSSSRYYTKGDVIGQGRNIVENSRNTNLTSRSEGGVGGGLGRSSQQHRPYQDQQQGPPSFRNYRGASSPDNSISPPISSPPITRSPPPQSRQYIGGGAGSARNYENGKLNGYGESNHTDDGDEQYSGSALARNDSERSGRSGDVGGAGIASNCLERGPSDPLKTEAPKQPGPESRVPGRDNNVPPASRRWVPPSLRPQHGLTQEAKNDAIFRKVRGILNKLTPEKFQELSDDLLKIDLNSTVILNGVIYLIFEKALDEPKYSSMYAQLCKRLSNEAPNFDPPSNTCTFLRLLLNVCRDKFLNRSTTSDIISHDGPLTPEEEEKRHVAKQRMLGNVKFIGELSKLHMLSENILHKCIQQLLDRKSKNVTIQDKCEDMECLCQLIRTCGKNLDTEQGKKLMEQYFEKMEQRSNSQKYPPRIRFMLRDVIELRKNNWIPRKVGTTEGPVPIRQIRADDENMIRPPYINRNRDMRNNERDSDNWMNRFPLNLQSGYNDMFNSFSGVSSPSHIMSPNSYNNNNRHHNERNNQNNNRHNYNNRFNKHNSHNQHNNSHNNSSYSNMMNNKDLAPRFKRNLIAASQDPVENLQMRPAANSLLFKANVNIKTPPLPITTPPPSIQSSNNYNSLNANSINNSTPSANSIQQQSRPTSAPASDTSQTSINSNASLSQNSMKNSSSQSIGSGQAPLNNTASKDASLLKQGSTEKVEKKQSKKDKVDNNENDDKNMDDIVASFYELKVPDKFMKETCVCIFNEIIDKSEQQYDRVIEFIQQLRRENKIPANSLLEAFRQIVNRMSEKEATIPRITTLVATLLSRAVNAKICKLADIASYTKGGQHYPLFLLVLQQLHKIMGKNQLSDLFTESKVSLMTTLPEADRTKDRMAEILDDRNLSFLYPLLKLQAEMWKQIQTDPNPQTFYKWIKGNVDSKYYGDAGFITALVTVILKYVVQDSTFNENADIKQNPDKSQIEKEQALLNKYHNVLAAFLHGDHDLQLIAVYALQVYCHNLGFPKGMLCRWFKNLYEGNVIEEEPFVRWKEEITDEYPGKGEALFQVNTWLTWLEQAESEDED